MELYTDSLRRLLTACRVAAAALRPLALWRQLAVVVWLSLWSVALYGQPSLPGRQAGVTYLDVKAGLPKNHVSDMLLDSHGFVWISTAGGGVVRYDGYQMRTVPDGVNGSNASRKMAEDSFGRVWVAFDEHTTVFSLRTLQPVVPVSKKVNMHQLLSASAVYVLRDSQQRMWVVTRTHINLLTFDDEGRVKDLARCSYTNDNPGVVLSDVMGDGRVWANIDGGIYRLEKQGDKLVKQSMEPALQQLKGYYVPAMMRWGNKVWLATNNGLYSYDVNTQNVQAYRHDVSPTSLSHDYCTALATDASGRLLVGTLRGVNTMVSEEGQFSHWHARTPLVPLSSDFVCCFLTLQGQLWVGTETGGVNQIAPRQLILSNYNHSDDPASLATNLVNAMYCEPNGRLWVGTVEGGLNMQEPGSQDFRHFTTANSRLTHNTVSTLAADQKGRLWIGTWNGGVCLIDLRNPTHIEPLVVDEPYRSLIRDVGALAFDERNNGLWIGCNAGLFFYDLTRNAILDPFKGNREMRGCIGSTITRDGYLWMGCIFGVRVVDLRHRQKDGTFPMRALTCRLNDPDSRVVDHITSICEAADGTLWLGSNSYGLYHRTVDAKGKEHFEAFTTDDGLPDNTVKGIVEDSHQQLWITTENGLSVYSPKTRTFVNYNENDGLLSSEFYWNSVVIQGTRIFLGSVAGLSVVEGVNQLSPHSGDIRFTGLVIDNRPVMADSVHLSEDITSTRQITIHQREHSLSVYFSALHYGHGEQGLYSYRLRGLSKEWVTLPAGEHGVHFSALSPGRYTLEVRYAQASDVEAVAQGELTIVVKPYFYRSWWFTLLVLALVAAAAVWMYKRRVRLLVRDEAERQLAPIRKELEESENPEQFRDRIAHILNNELKLRDSLSKSVAADREKTAQMQPKPFMDRVTEIMEAHYMDSEFGIDEFCAEIGMSRTLVNKNLNNEAGVALSQFIKNYRLNIASKLLLTNKANRNITEIAYSVGFNDPKYFTRCFTRLYGVSPSNYGRQEEE